MQRISIEESKNYIPTNEDFFNSPSYFFTIETDKEGWDVITYFTNRKRGIYVGKEGNEYVYVLSNPSIPGMLKIGSTSLSPEDRAKAISRGTGIPEEFEVIWAYQCFKAEKIEREVHKMLKEHRVNNQREFFRVELETAIEAIESIGKKYV